MNYHNIQKDDMLNGTGIRVVLFVSGCTHNCFNCHNPQTHAFDSGIPFDESAKSEILSELSKDYIHGITLSGGDPLNPNNIAEIFELCDSIKQQYKDSKSIWCYTGYTWEELLERANKEYLLSDMIETVFDVIVDGRYIEQLKDENYPFAGSTNQRIIDVKKSLEQNEIVIWNS